MSGLAVVAISVVAVCIGLCALSFAFKVAKWLIKTALFLAILAAITFLLLHLRG